MKEIEIMIQNLERTSEALEKVANKKENYNSCYSHYLEQISWEIHRQANDLKSINNFGVFL